VEKELGVDLKISFSCFVEKELGVDLKISLLLRGLPYIPFNTDENWDVTICHNLLHYINIV
jgi:hypothetical protein